MLQRGFTLLELLIVIAIAGLLFLVAGIFRPAERLQTLELERATDLVRNELTRAREDSMAGAQDSSWGLWIESGATTRFAGPNYASRDPQNDVTFPIAAPVTLSGASQIVFSRIDGSTDAAAITVSDGTHTNTVNVNSAGVIFIE